MSTKLIVANTEQMCSVVSLQKALQKCGYRLLDDIPIISKLSEARLAVKAAVDLDSKVDALQRLTSVLRECTNPSLLPTTLRLAGFTLTLQAGSYRIEREVDKYSDAAGRYGDLKRKVRKLSNSYKEVQGDLERDVLEIEGLAKQAKSEQERRALIALVRAEREADRAACENRRAEMMQEIERRAPGLCDQITKHEVGKKVQYVLVYRSP